MKKIFLTLLLFIPLLAACSPTKPQPERIAYRWEIYDINFSYPSNFHIIEDRQITFNGAFFDAIIIGSTDSLGDPEIEVMAQDNNTVENILRGLDGVLDYEDMGNYTVGDYEYRKICYEISETKHCSYLTEQNRKYYQFNLDDAYSDEFLKSIAFVE